MLHIQLVNLIASVATNIRNIRFKGELDFLFSPKSWSNQGIKHMHHADVFIFFILNLAFSLPALLQLTERAFLKMIKGTCMTTTWEMVGSMNSS